MIYTLGDSLLKQRRDLTSTLMKEECLKEMDADGSGKVDKMEFLRFELVRRGVCKKHDIDNVLAIFDALDTDHSGELDFEDMKKVVFVNSCMCSVVTVVYCMYASSFCDYVND